MAYRVLVKWLHGTTVLAHALVIGSYSTIILLLLNKCGWITVDAYFVIYALVTTVGTTVPRVRGASVLATAAAAAAVPDSSAAMRPVTVGLRYYGTVTYTVGSASGRLLRLRLLGLTLLLQWNRDYCRHFSNAQPGDSACPRQRLPFHQRCRSYLQ